MSLTFRDDSDARGLAYGLLEALVVYLVESPLDLGDDVVVGDGLLQVVHAFDADLLQASLHRGVIQSVETGVRNSTTQGN